MSRLERIATTRSCAEVVATSHDHKHRLPRLASVPARWGNVLCDVLGRRGFQPVASMWSVSAKLVKMPGDTALGKHRRTLEETIPQAPALAFAELVGADRTM